MRSYGLSCSRRVSPFVFPSVQVCPDIKFHSLPAALASLCHVQCMVSFYGEPQNRLPPISRQQAFPTAEYAFRLAPATANFNNLQ